MEKRSILIVDDEPDILLTFTVVLRQEGFDVEAIDNADAALAAISKCPGKYCLMLIDLQLDHDEFSGLMLARSIRKVNPDIKIALITASDQYSDDLIDAVNTKVVNQILRKPISNELLVGIAKKECVEGRPKGN
jgi:DNA-binding NtrC family response regulator